MADDAHAAANAAQLRLLQEELAAALTLPGHPAATGSTDLPPAENAAWPEAEFTRPGPEERSV